MHSQSGDRFGSLLECLPPVDFCCVYGSTLHPNSNDKSKMVDYILGVSDPLQWHIENLKMNKHHYASWMAYLGGAKLITQVADNIGVGVHFNPFVSYNDRMFKYGVVRMSDLVEDVLQWERFYLSGRLQKPVHVIVDHLGIQSTNLVNLRAAVSAALLLLPAKFTEADLYAKICSLSYMGDVRMLFAEDRNKVKNIVAGQFDFFKTMYKQTLADYEAKDLLKVPLPNVGTPICQDFSLLAAQKLFSYLPSKIKSENKSRDNQRSIECGNAKHEIMIRSREEAASRMMKVVRRTVMVSSARQAVSGLISAGGANAARYLSRKICKAWKSWT